LEKLEDADVRAFGLAGIDGVPIPYIPEMGYVWGPWTDALNAILSQEMSAFEAFRNANAIIMKQIGR
jgi:maltose-binding protein MalE